MYLWSLQHGERFGWATALLFAVCSVLRLARFNTMVGQELPHWAHNYFTGVPTPAGAGLAILPLIMWLQSDGRIDEFREPAVVGVFMVIVAILMVSRVPTFSGKNMRVKPQLVLPIMILIGLIGAFLVTDTWLTLSVIGLVYLAAIPMSMMSFNRLRRAPVEPGPGVGH
jgi:CDP-diacylglycerol--serine O-phosphatidyltransferase